MLTKSITGQSIDKMEGLAAFLNGLLELCISENKKGKNMPYVTSIERIAKGEEPRGESEGKIQGSTSETASFESDDRRCLSQ